MKLNKPHVFLYRTSQGSSDLKLIVLVPTKYENVSKVTSNENDSHFCIELRGNESNSEECREFVFDVAEKPHRCIKILTKLENEPEGFTVLKTSKASHYNNVGYFTGFHLEADKNTPPKIYTIHGVANKFGGTFSIGKISPNNVNPMNYDAALGVRSNQVGHKSASKGFTEIERSQANADKVKLIINPTKQKPFTSDGEVILHHADSDPGFLSNEQTCE